MGPTKMPNRLITLLEMEADIARSVEQACAEYGITVTEFWQGVRDAWNAAIDAEEAESDDTE